MENLRALFGSSSFMPHGHCFLWLPEILWLNVGSDAFIAFAYFTIPLALMYIVRKRNDLRFNAIFYMFATFILACGATHVFHIITIWQPYYFLQGLVKFITAVASFGTGIFLYRLVPTILSFPSNSMLEEANTKLKALNTNLEKIVSERTKELVMANERLERERDAAAQAQKQAIESEAKLQIALDGAKMGIWSWDKDRNQLEISEWGRRHLGLPLTGPVSFHDWLDKLHPADLPEDKDHLYQSELNAALFILGNRDHMDGTYRVRSRPDDEHYIGVKGRRIQDSQENLIAAEGILADVTERRMLEEARTLSLANEQAALESSRLKSEFLAMMSHEIRTPINGVIGMAQLMRETNLNDEQKTYCEAISLSADSLLTVINDVLDFSKVEAGKIDLEELNFNLWQLIDDTSKVFIPAARQKNLKFVIESDVPKDGYFIGDQGRIRQVLSNLLGNAIKFTENGAIRLKIQTVKTSAEQSRFRFRVEDSGIGLSSQDMTKLFQPFTQADSSTTRKFGGTGLGLSISKKLVELMGGDIGAENMKGGALFWFELPLKTGTAKEFDQPQSLAEMKKSDKNLRILIAEDHPVNQKVALSIIEKMGFKGHVVANGLEAVDALEKMPFDLVFMDCNMPEMDGYEATKRIRVSRLTLNRSVPIVAMTANAMKGDKEKCQEAGMNDYISKPFKIAHLLSIIEKWT